MFSLGQSFWRNRLSGFLLDQITTPAAAAYSTRKLRAAYTGPALRMRRSSDNAEQDINFATAIQTRTNLAPVPAASGDSRTVAGITLTVVGTGTEFGQSYVDVRWNGTATGSGNLQYSDTILTSSPNSTSSALVTPGETYTCSMGYRLVAGTFPTFSVVRLAPTYRAGITFVVSLTNVTIPLPDATVRRAAVTSVAPATANYVQNFLSMTGVTPGFVCDFTLRIYAPNTEVGVGNARPLLDRYVPEIIAGIGDLDAEAVLAFQSSENRLLSSEMLENAAVWGLAAGCTITANAATAPDGTVTADRLDCNLASVLLVLNQGVTTTVAAGDIWTASVWVRNASPGMLLRVFRLGGGALEFTAESIPVSSEWQRITATHTFAASQTGVRFDIVAPAGVTSVEVWGAQLNTGSVALPYTPTTATAQTFNTNSAFLPVWYDQSGNAFDQSQATAANQPSTNNLGAIHTVNGRPSVQTGGTQFIQANFGLGTIAQPFTRGYVLSRLDNVALSGSAAHYIGNLNSAPNTTEYGPSGTTINMYAGGTPHGQTVQQFVLNETAVFTSIYNNAVGNNLTKNGVTLTAPANFSGATNGLNGARIGAIAGGTTGLFGASEYMVFASVLSVQEVQTLQRNQGAYFGVTVA